MDPDLSSLSAFLDDAGTDGYLFDTDGDDADQYYLSGFTAPDGVVTLCDGEVRILTSQLEFARAKNESRAASVDRTADYDFRAKVDEHGRREGKIRAIAAFLDDHCVGSVSVPKDFPLGTADGLRDLGVDVAVADEDPIGDARAVKTDAEIEDVRAVQSANETAMATAEDLIRSATVVDGDLHADGAPLTSERVKAEIEVALLREGAALDETIVAGGADAAEPHNRGSGPLAAGEPIIVDIFPRDKSTKFHGDMTRTFVRGEPSETAREWYDLTREAFEAALETIEPGVTGEAVDDAVCDVYEDAGLPTLRDDESAATGFIHSTGHGVGLEVHENPSLGQGADEKLEPGHIVTVEPGLYDPEVGGVRIEDLVVVTEDGYENLTDYPIEFVVE
ncbi:MAG: Xaa-Pro peptidase family protein [Halobacteriales archaeon]